eukprot:m.65379 g.65379  ORF g.65379 m.65379 type:complete len:195 (+) comp14027_c0_seq23:2071-2655(+)
MDLIQGQEQINDRGYLELDNSVPEVVIDVGSIKITMPRVYKGKDMEEIAAAAALAKLRKKAWTTLGNRCYSQGCKLRDSATCLEERVESMKVFLRGKGKGGKNSRKAATAVEKLSRRATSTQDAALTQSEKAGRFYAQARDPEVSAACNQAERHLQALCLSDDAPYFEAIIEIQALAGQRIVLVKRWNEVILLD